MSRPRFTRRRWRFRDGRREGQGETIDQVRKFLDTRDISTPVGFDATQSVARKYGVEGIPHTVVIGRDGKIAFVKTGFSPEGEKEISAAVEKALE